MSAPWPVSHVARPRPARMAGMIRPIRRRIVTVVLVVLAATGIANANAQNWFGVRSGYPLGVTVHYGIAGALGSGADLRVSGRVVAHGGAARVGLGLDAMTTVSSTPPFDVYVGAGPAIEFGDGGAWLDLHGLFGGEFRFTDLGAPQLGLFLEGTLGGSIGLSSGKAEVPTFGAALGFNYHFR